MIPCQYTSKSDKDGESSLQEHRPTDADPLAPLMKEMTHSMVDVPSEEPQRLHTLDNSELHEDLAKSDKLILSLREIANSV